MSLKAIKFFKHISMTERPCDLMKIADDFAKQEQKGTCYPSSLGDTQLAFNFDEFQLLKKTILEAHPSSKGV